jgi:hypothetical protein
MAISYSQAALNHYGSGPNMPQLDPEEEELKRQQEQQQAEEAQAAPATSQVGDIFQGVAYGAAESGRSLYGLADWALGDSLPDWDTPTFDAPKTLAGSLVGGIAQFAVPYAGMAGVLAGVARFSKATSQTGQIVGWLRGANSGAGASKALNAVARGDTVLGMSRAAVFGQAVARETAKGGIIDFLAFEGGGERLSNILEDHPATRNAVTEWLASDEDDAEIVGRAKNVLEGALVGSVFDAVAILVKGVRAGRKVKAVGGTAEEIRAAEILAVDDSLKSAAEAKQIEQDAAYRAIQEEDITVKTEDGSFEVVKGKDQMEATDEYVAGLVRDGDVLAEDAPVKLPGESQSLTRAQRKAQKKANKADVELQRTQRAQGVTESDEIKMQDTMGEVLSNRGAERGLDANPRKQTQVERDAQGTKKNSRNLSGTTLRGTKGYDRLFSRAIESIDLNIDRPSTTQLDYAAQALKRTEEIFGVSHTASKMRFAELGEESVQAIALGGQRAALYNAEAQAIAEEWGPQMLKLAESSADISQDEFLQLTYSFKNYLGLGNAAQNIKSQIGTELRLSSMPLSKRQEKSLSRRLDYKPLDDFLFADTENFDAAQVKKIVKDLAGVMNSPDPIANIKAAQEMLDAPWHKKATMLGIEYYLNALLSGIGTQVVNLMGAVNMSVFLPLERAMGARIEIGQAAFTGNEKMMKEARRVLTEETMMSKQLMNDFFRGYGAMRQSGGDFASNSMMEGQARNSTIKTLAQGSKHEGFFNKASDFINLPSKYLVAGDKLIKTWNGVSRVTSMVEADLILKDTKPEDIAALVEEKTRHILKSKGRLKMDLEYRRAFDKASGGVDSHIPEVLTDARAKELMKYTTPEIEHMVDIEERAMLDGKEATFTNEGRPGLFTNAAAMVNTMKERHPMLTFLAPFVNTPANLADAAWDRTLGGALGAIGALGNQLGKSVGLKTIDSEKSITRLQRELVSADPRIRQRAKTNMAWGLGMMGSIATLTAIDEDDPQQPILTGSGPTNPDTRASLEAAGWQPFSIKINGAYVSYSRLDPFGTIIGIVADSSEYLKEQNDEDGQNWFQAVLTAATASVANNITEKTYAQGMKNALDLLLDPEKNAERVLGGVVGSFIPTIVANTEKVLDPDLQEIRSWVDRLQSRVPGWSAGLPPQRDLLGEVITKEGRGREFLFPIRITRVKDKAIEQELSRYAYGFSQPLTSKGGVDLLSDDFKVGKQDAYDRYLELSGSHKIRGKDLRQALKVLVKSPAYLRLDPEEGPEGEKSPRILLINATLRKHRAAAWKQLLKEIPSLRSATKQSTKDRADRRAGRRGLTL